jgi:hypothetical protein
MEGAAAAELLPALIAAVAQGDRGALRALYEHQSVRIFGVAQAILRDRDAAGMRCMTPCMTIPADPEARDALAAEYVLGTLEAREAAELARALETDAALREAVAAWEARLAPLSGPAPPGAAGRRRLRHPGRWHGRQCGAGAGPGRAAPHRPRQGHADLHRALGRAGGRAAAGGGHRHRRLAMSRSGRGGGGGGGGAPRRSRRRAAGVLFARRQAAGSRHCRDAPGV